MSTEFLVNRSVRIVKNYNPKGTRSQGRPWKGLLDV